MDVPTYLKTMGVLDAFFLAGGLFAHSTLKPGFLNPPIGEPGTLILPPCLLIGMAITTVLPLMHTSDKAFKGMIYLGFVTSLLCGALYVTDLQNFGRPIVIPQRGISDFVIGGSERTPFAERYFAKASDTEMLEERGWSENDLELYWTRASLSRARLSILLGIAGVLTSVNLITAGAAALTIEH